MKEVKLGPELRTVGSGHKLGTTEPRCLPRQSTGLCYMFSLFLCVRHPGCRPSPVPARLWEGENDPCLDNAGHGLVSWGSLRAKRELPFPPGGSGCDSSPLTPRAGRGLKLRLHSPPQEALLTLLPSEAGRSQTKGFGFGEPEVQIPPLLHHSCVTSSK